MQYQDDLDPKVASKGFLNSQILLYHTSRGTSSALENLYKSMS